jgi:quercetin dioxygenase-like cupin family protein
MADTTIKKVEAGSSPQGEMGQKYLVSGKRVSMRIWIDEPGGKLKAPTTRDYETVGYVISGSAKLDLEGQTLNLKAGDSWLVPAGATHRGARCIKLARMRDNRTEAHLLWVALASLG